MISWIFWNPNPVCFTLPYFHRPIMWYGICWGIGFLIALFITGEIVKRFFSYSPGYVETDILNRGAIKAKLKEKFGIEGENIVALLNGLLLKERFKEPKKMAHKILVNFARKRLDESQFCRLVNRLYLDEYLEKKVLGLVRRSSQMSEHGWIFIAVGTVVGARLGHILFYHHPLEYFLNPLRIFLITEGGLASHGAVFGILLSLYVWDRWKRSLYPSISFLGWADLSVIPVLFGCAMIRIGNFFNQELLGTVTQVPWAIIFGNPEDGGLPQPRHPVQLYEAVLYLILMGVFYRIFFRKKTPLRQGTITGLLLIAVFTFRFIIEFWKEQQGYFDPYMMIHMGQLLSIPCILIGILMLVVRRKGLDGVDSLGS